MSKEITFQDIFNHTSNGIIVTDRLGIVVLINNLAAHYLHMDRNLLIGRDIRKVLPTAGNDVFNCLKTGKPELGKIESENHVRIIINVSPIIAAPRRIKGAIINFQHIHQMEKSARQLESFKTIHKQLETIFATSSDGIWVCDATGRIIALNHASERLNGIKAEEVIGQHVSILVKKEITDRILTPEVIRKKQQVSIMQYNRRTGRYLMLTGKPALDDEGNLLLVVVNERDMTELNQLQLELEDSKRAVQKARSELARFNWKEVHGHNIVAENKRMREVYQIALKLSQTEASNILILGESGTGKGLISKFIHQNSTRSKKPFVQINCAALPEPLLEAELFGYEKGAFTGARDQGKAGLFELAHGGTLFLDEIGDMPLVIQAKLLTYLDNYEILRLGSTKPKKIDCQLIAATNQDLAMLVKTKKFRQDLFHRLNTFTITIPPLRERPEDVFELTRVLLSTYNQKYHADKVIRETGIKALQGHAFTGNVRELQNILKEAVVICESREIDAYLAGKIERDATDAIDYLQTKDLELPFDLQDQVDAFEKNLLSLCAQKCRTTSQLAKAANMSQPTAFRKLRKYGITMQGKRRR